MSPSRPSTLVVALMWVVGGCTADNGPRLVDEPASSPCDDPYVGFDRLQRAEDGWGLSTGLKPPIDGNSAQAGLVVSDLDGDGDLDVLLGRQGEHPGPGPYRGFPRVFANEAGVFHEALQPTREHEIDHGPASVFFAIDLDGDRLPEVIRFGEGWFDWLPNRGNLEWGEPQVVHATPLDGGISVGPRINAMSAGDLDGDGDQDLSLLSEFGGVPGAARSAFWRNDGLGPEGRPLLVNDAEAMHADLWPGGHIDVFEDLPVRQRVELAYGG